MSVQKMINYYFCFLTFLLFFQFPDVRGGRPSGAAVSEGWVSWVQFSARARYFFFCMWHLFWAALPYTCTCWLGGKHLLKRMRMHTLQKQLGQKGPVSFLLFVAYPILILFGITFSFIYIHEYAHYLYMYLQEIGESLAFATCLAIFLSFLKREKNDRDFMRWGLQMYLSSASLPPHT